MNCAIGISRSTLASIRFLSSKAERGSRPNSLSFRSSAIVASSTFRTLAEVCSDMIGQQRLPSLAWQANQFLLEP